MPDDKKPETKQQAEAKPEKSERDERRTERRQTHETEENPLIFRGSD